MSQFSHELYIHGFVAVEKADSANLCDLTLQKVQTKQVFLSHCRIRQVRTILKYMYRKKESSSGISKKKLWVNFLNLRKLTVGY